jgi:nucleoside-diphosphate-sugar epimerase
MCQTVPTDVRVLVTGGSGFVGSHTIAALVQAGHEVVALARDPARLEAALEPLNVPRIEVARGDVVDRDAVARALAGASAVVHAAGVYALDHRRRQEMWRTNVDGTKVVLGAALDAGCDPVVHVSSVVALWPLPQAQPAPLEPAVGKIRTPYVGSKVAAERFARELQARGAPVVTTYPGNVWGPHDPAAGEMIQILRGFLGNRFPFLLFGAGITVADVRWLARAHAALVVPGLGPRIVTMGGRFYPMNEWFGLLRELTGRRLPQLLPSPKLLAWLMGWLADRISALIGRPLLYGAEKFLAAYWTGRTDDRRAIALAGEPPSPEETVRESIAWAVRAGHLPRPWAGRVVE